MYLLAGNIERSFDETDLRPDGAILPTNNKLKFAARFPTTQRALVDRVKLYQPAWHALTDASKGLAGKIEMATQPVVVELKPPPKTPSLDAAPFPPWVCLLATDFPQRRQW